MIKLLLGDCRERLKDFPDCSVDSIVTDPPYEIGFMGKSWDSTGVAYDVAVWAECLRVLKHGGHLLAFGGSRTYHRLAVAIEDAGFQIRDQIMWVYGSGFPKSLNIGKAIDKAAGAEREVLSSRVKKAGDITGGNFKREGSYADKLLDTTAPATAEAKQWEGWGTALKPAHEPIVLARKPLDGTVANNVLTHGVGGINIDGCRVESPDNDGKVWTRGGNGVNARSGSKQAQDDPQLNGETTVVQPNVLGRFPANFIHDGSDEVLELFPDSKSGGKNVSDVANANGLYRSGFGGQVQSDMAASSGSAARFFYCAKANKKDRNAGLDGFAEKRPDERSVTGMGTFEEKGVAKQANHHPTVKPTDLMRYLCRLVTPPNGVVLDPFTGSGSTGKAAVLEGFSFIGVEQSEEYIEIAKARIESTNK